ncbi:MAG: dTDP-4-dehydrorhamnose 3,5-epimerase family protein [Planctomycetota bacterium]|jgi:dTDP-4-dehydrorhamnose 3,5-epimerase
MNLHPTELPGVMLLELEPRRDERGEFVRTWCRATFARLGLDADLAQCSVSRNPVRGTLRGLHYQRPPCAETKLVRCSRGAMHDVVLDLRPGSPTRGRWLGVELRADRPVCLSVPSGVAHGFLTLEEDTEVHYQMSRAYEPAAAAGVRWDDPAFAIEWPAPPVVMSDRDRRWPDVDPRSLPVPLGATP